MALRSFRGGVHPHEHKELTEARPLEVLPTPAELHVPLGQHLGKPASPLVKKGTYVRQGQLLAESSGFISAPVHAPVGGTIKKMVKGPVVGGTTADMFLLVPGDPEPPKQKDDDTEEPPPVDTSPVLLPSLPLDTVTAEQIVERVKEAASSARAVRPSPPRSSSPRHRTSPSTG